MLKNYLYIYEVLGDKIWNYVELIAYLRNNNLIELTFEEQKKIFYDVDFEGERKRGFFRKIFEFKLDKEFLDLFFEDKKIDKSLVNRYAEYFKSYMHVFLIEENIINYILEKYSFLLKEISSSTYSNILRNNNYSIDILKKIYLIMINNFELKLKNGESFYYNLGDFITYIKNMDLLELIYNKQFEISNEDRFIYDYIPMFLRNKYASLAILKKIFYLIEKNFIKNKNLNISALKYYYKIFLQIAEHQNSDKKLKEESYKFRKKITTRSINSEQ